MIVKDRDPLVTAHGKKPSERSIEETMQAGVINLDKPIGPTSHQVTAWVRDILSVEKIGHGGTLDPKVSGVLPITLGRATRATDLVLRSDKEYVCVMRLHRDVEAAKLGKVLMNFEGDIFQTPPVRSAVKRQTRIRRVHSIKILELKGRDVLFRVRCDAGTYIRTLCADAGDALGVGAHMEDLRRVRSGAMEERDSVTLQDLRDAYVFWQQGKGDWLKTMIRPMETLLEPFRKIVAKDSAVDALCHGADLAAAGIARLEDGISKGEAVAIFSLKGEAVGVGIALASSEEMTRAREGLMVSTDRVFMEPGTYPKMWETAPRPSPEAPEE
jgi:H/ACA ribonucleoprotein complex subunit 4